MRVNSSSTDPWEPGVGQRAPVITVTNALDSSGFCLSDLWKEGPAVLVFLRHLGCSFCREHVAQLRQDRDRFRDCSASIGLVTVGLPRETEAFCRERDLFSAFTCLCDPGKAAYEAYGLSRAPARELITPHVLARGFQAALHGHFVGMPKGDPFQMPGTFIVDVHGEIRYAHRHRDMADNPPNADLFAVLESLRPKPLP